MMMRWRSAAEHALNEDAYVTRMFDKAHVFLREGIQQAYEARSCDCGDCPAGLGVVEAAAQGHPIRNTQIIWPGGGRHRCLVVSRDALCGLRRGQAWYYIGTGDRLAFMLLVVRVLRTFRSALEAPVQS